MHNRPLNAPNTHRQSRKEKALKIPPPIDTVVDNAGNNNDGAGATQTTAAYIETTMAGRCDPDRPPLEVLTNDTMTCGIFLGNEF